MTPPAHRHGALYSVQLMRGLAALIVVAHHTSLIMAHPEYGAMHAFERATKFGWTGVNFFFVLSGFIILFAHSKDIGRKDRIGHYLWRRFSRVYPIYWIFLTVFIGAAVTGFGRVDFGLDWPNLLTSYTLIEWVVPALPLKVAWTLFYEIFFYGMFGLLILSKRGGTAAFLIWIAAILFSAFGLGQHDMGWASAWNINFLLGGAVYYGFTRIDPKYGLVVLLAGAGVYGALAAGGWIYDRPDLEQVAPLPLIAIGLAFAGVLLGGVLAERHYRLRVPRVLLMFGDASYAMYLVHSAVISASCMINRRLDHGRLPDWAVFCLIFAVAVTAGVAVHFVIERPVLALMRRRRAG